MRIKSFDEIKTESLEQDGHFFFQGENEGDKEWQSETADCGVVCDFSNVRNLVTDSGQQ